MKKNLLLAATLFISASAFSQPVANRKATFADQDIFQSAVFLENKSVIPDYKTEKILYYAEHADIHAFFTEKGVIYKLCKITKAPGKARDKKGEEEEGDNGIRINTSLAVVEWEGANPHPLIVSENKASGYYTYIQKEGNSYKTIITEGYKTIRYKELYPGIDVEYTIPANGGIEYNLVVQPGADISLVKLHYAGDIKKMRIDRNRNIIVHTKNGNMVEHAPQTYYRSSKPVTSAFSLTGNRLQFNLPEGYDHLQQLTIDPWVTAITTLATQNMGFNVDYDFAGNLFVFGAGPVDDEDFSQNFKIAKYDVNGNILWTFLGSVPSVGWTTGDQSYDYNCPGNISVDKSTGKMYAGKGVDDSYTQTIRLDQNGNYDNFITAANDSVTETWGFAYNCANESILEMGGGISSDINIGVINTTSGAITAANITGATNGSHEDILCATYDSAGNLYLIVNDRLGYIPYHNTLYKVNSTINGYTWVANTGFAVFNELENAPYWNNSLYQGNWFNALAANGSYLYYYDGYNLAAYDLATGAQVGNSYSINGYTALYQAGIAVDNCNNVYVGGQGVINTFYFDGTNFNPTAGIPLGNAFENSAVLDIKYNAASNLLYISGNGIAGTYTATMSTSCIQQSSYNVSISSKNCDSATVHVSPSGNLNPLVFTYLWTDSANNIVSELSNTSDTLNTVTGLPNGTYQVQVQWNTNCGGTSQSKTVLVKCYPFTHSNDTTICIHQPVTLWASSATGNFSWSPGGDTTSSITVSPDTSTAYTVTYSPPTGASSSDTIYVTVAQIPVVTIPDTTVCAGSRAVLTSSVSVPGGTYLWAPGGANTSSILVAPFSTTDYTLRYTVDGCTPATGSGTVNVLPAPPDSIIADKPGFCPGDSSLICAVAGYLSYRWSNNSHNTCIIVSSAGSYNVIISDTNGCTTSSDTITITAYPSPVDSISSNKSVFCPTDSAQICSQGIFTSYLWNTGETGDCIEATKAGDYYVTVTDNNGCTAQSNQVPISLYPVPSVPIIVEGDLLTSRAGVTYQWYLNDMPIPGATADTLQVTQSGAYSLEVTDSYGCYTLSDPVNMVSTGIGNSQIEHLSLYPNPSTGTWQLEVDNDLVGSTLSVYDTQGQLIYQSGIKNLKSEIVLNVATGVYWLRISSVNGSIVRKMVKL